MELPLLARKAEWGSLRKLFLPDKAENYLPQKFISSITNGREAAKVQLQENCLLAGGFLELFDGGFCLASRTGTHIHLGVVLEQGLPTGYLERCLR